MLGIGLQIYLNGAIGGGSLSIPREIWSGLEEGDWQTSEFECVVFSFEDLSLIGLTSGPPIIALVDTQGNKLIDTSGNALTL